MNNEALKSISMQSGPDPSQIEDSPRGILPLFVVIWLFGEAKNKV